MAAVQTERSNSSRAVFFIGTPAVGKEAVATEIANILGGRMLNTERLIRAAAHIGESSLWLKCIDEEQSVTLPGAIRRLVGLMRIKQRGLHFAPVEGDRSLHIFDGRTDLTESIHPRYRRKQGWSNLEPLAAILASKKTIHREMIAVWKRSIREQNVTAVIAKRPAELIHTPLLVVWLTADPALSAGYRFLTGANATESYADELEYLKRRNDVYQQSALEVVPSGALHIDMNPYLLTKRGPCEAAGMVYREYTRRRDERSLPVR